MLASFPSLQGLLHLANALRLYRKLISITTNESNMNCLSEKIQCTQCFCSCSQLCAALHIYLCVKGLDRE